MLTLSQLQAIKAAIAADTALSSQPMTPDGAFAIAEALNQLAVPDFIVWRSKVSNGEVGKAFVASSLSAMTSANNDRLVSFVLWNPDGVEPQRADHRVFFDDVFSPASGAPTRTALAALWRRRARRVEKLFAVGTGSDGAPATLGFEGTINYQDVEAARAL
jgi:hypothetical protein